MGKKHKPLVVYCLSCNKRSEFFGKDKMTAYKQMLFSGWKPMFLDLMACPTCTRRVEEGEMPLPDPATAVGGEVEEW